MEEPQPLQPIFIPSLSKALAPFLAEDVLHEQPKYSFQKSLYKDSHVYDFYLRMENVCPSQINEFLGHFTIFMHRFREGKIGPETKLSDCFRLEEACDVILEVLKIIDIPQTLSLISASNGLSMPQALVWLIKCAVHPMANLTPIQASTVMKMLLEEPEYNHRVPGNWAEQQDMVQHPPPCSHGVLPDFTEALQHFMNLIETKEITKEEGLRSLGYVIDGYTSIGTVVAEVWKYWNHNHPSHWKPSYAIYKGGSFIMDSLWGRMLTDSFSPIPHEVRTVLAEKINIKGAWDEFWSMAMNTCKGKEAAGHNPLEGLTVLKHDPFYFKGGIILQHMKAEGDIGSYMRDVYAVRKDFPYLLDPFSVPQPTSLCVLPTVQLLGDYPSAPMNMEVSDFLHPSGGFMDPDDEADQEFYGIDLGIFPEYEPVEDLEDVEMIPDGPPIDINGLITRVSEPPIDSQCSVCMYEFDPADEPSSWVALLVCNHLYHLDCIDGQINSGTVTSNKCSLCRAVICERRAMKPDIPQSE